MPVVYPQGHALVRIGTKGSCGGNLHFIRTEDLKTHWDGENDPAAALCDFCLNRDSFANLVGVHLAAVASDAALARDVVEHRPCRERTARAKPLAKRLALAAARATTLADDDVDCDDHDDALAHGDACEDPRTRARAAGSDDFTFDDSATEDLIITGTRVNLRRVALYLTNMGPV